LPIHLQIPQGIPTPLKTKGKPEIPLLQRKNTPILPILLPSKVHQVPWCEPPLTPSNTPISKRRKTYPPTNNPRVIQKPHSRHLLLHTRLRPSHRRTSHNRGSHRVRISGPRGNRKNTKVIFSGVEPDRHVL